MAVKLPVFERKVEGRGNCFYNAVYEALKERKLVKPTKDFNTKFRHLVANEISRNPPAQLRVDYDTIKNAYASARRNCQAMRREIGYSYQPLDDCVAAAISSEQNVPQWAVKNYMKSASWPQFIEKYIAASRESGNEVEEIQTDAAQRILKKHGIRLEIVMKGYENKDYFSADLTDQEKELILKDMPPIYILLKGASGAAASGAAASRAASKRSSIKRKRSSKRSSTSKRSSKRSSTSKRTSGLTQASNTLAFPVKLPYETSTGVPIIYLINEQAEKHFNYFSFNEYYGGARKKSRKRSKRRI